MTALPFLKMHGLGNDFVVIDARRQAVALDEAQTRRIADRRQGIGCDQLILIEPAKNRLADAFMRIRNSDGGEVEACGNATRCVADLLMKENGSRHVVIETMVGLLDAEAAGDGLISVDMGPARLDWREIPLAKATDTLHLDVPLGALKDPVAVNIGNPHAVFFVDDAEAVDLTALGPVLERHPLFPERGQCRGRDDPLAREDPHAGLGARCRHHARLRHRRLRHLGRRRAAQAHRPARRDPARRRQPRDRMDGRQSPAHDGPGCGQLRRRAALGRSGGPSP